MRVLYGFLALFLIGCGPNIKEAEQPSSNGSQRALSATCPIVTKGSLEDAESLDALELVYVEAISAELVILRSALEFAPGARLVKLHGVTTAGVSAGRQTLGRQRIQQLATTAYFAPADPGCALRLSDGGEGTFGQLFTLGGENVSEILLREQLVLPAPPGEPCGGEQLRSCYQALQSSAPEIFSAFSVQRILWKPEADKDGKLVVLVDLYGTNIFVNGEKLADSGPGNGYGTQARGRRPGCGYGANAKVEIFDNAGERIRIRGEPSLTIANPCERVELR